MQASGSLVKATEKALGANWMIDTPLWVEGTNKCRPVAAPRVGEHTREILTDAGFSETQIDEFAAQGVFEPSV